MTLQGRTFIARHAETVFNAAARMQGNDAHTPLTRAGFAQAEAMGEALKSWIPAPENLTLWSSDAGRTLQTLAIIAEHIGADWHQARTDKRLREIDVGAWTGRQYADIQAEIGPFVDMEAGLFTVIPPEGEDFPAIASRLQSWIADQQDDERDRLIITHGMTARVLRGLLLDLPPDPQFGAPIAAKLPQGSVVMVDQQNEQIAFQPASTPISSQKVTA